MFDKNHQKKNWQHELPQLLIVWSCPNHRFRFFVFGSLKVGYIVDHSCLSEQIQNTTSIVDIKGCLGYGYGV